MLDALQPLLAAFGKGQYALVAALGLIVIVGMLRKFGGPTSWVYTNTGGTALALITSSAGTLAVTLATPGVSVSLGMLWTCLLAGITAAGGYVAIKNLLITPILRPLSLKAPAWSQPVFSALFWIFDKPDGAPVTVVVPSPPAPPVAPPPPVLGLLTSAPVVRRPKVVRRTKR